MRKGTFVLLGTMAAGLVFWSLMMNRQLQAQDVSKNMIPNGSYETHFDNGQLQEEGTYKDGKEVGKIEMHNEDGSRKE